MSAVPFHILLVDDEFADAELFIEVFQEASPHVQIHHTVNGREALDYLDQTGHGQPHPRPQLIVLDLSMPVMGGHEFLKLAKIHDSYRSIPVLVLATSNGESDIQESYRRYASGYAVKPSSFADLQSLTEVVSNYWQGVVTLPTIGELVK